MSQVESGVLQDKYNVKHKYLYLEAHSLNKTSFQLTSLFLPDTPEPDRQENKTIAASQVLLKLYLF